MLGRNIALATAAVLGLAPAASASFMTLELSTHSGQAAQMVKVIVGDEDVTGVGALHLLNDPVGVTWSIDDYAFGGLLADQHVGIRDNPTDDIQLHNLDGAILCDDSHFTNLLAVCLWPCSHSDRRQFNLAR